MQLTGKTEEEIYGDLKGVIFLNPLYEFGGNGSGAKYIPADEYLSGSGVERTVTYEAYTEKHLPPNIRQVMQRFYEDMMSDYPDVLTVADIVAITGYCAKTVNRWCASGDLQSFKRGHCNHIPKVILIEFLCSHHFRAFANKNAWHKSAMHEFALLVDKLDEIPAVGGDEQ